MMGQPSLFLVLDRSIRTGCGEVSNNFRAVTTGTGVPYYHTFTDTTSKRIIAIDKHTMGCRLCQMQNSGF